MAKRLTDRQRLALKIDSLTDSEIQEVLDYISIMEAMRRSRSLAIAWDDDWVARLAEEYENKRARQAFEWEAARRRAERRAAVAPISRI
ncbi:hypothetical protein [Pyrinomonas methylaliphatogenes]|uniref:Uncharacterized protein n=1 Tax=Pyrinomonas methylaliphatogenes TaxID=454194 RepID=A0A0B6X0A3_9BACT|nr:hypothetical protein [Pyrinomonas methylaliphatogenes]MBX5478001.1 hypothetical protein [Pyrinomonas methylaliphatogenes]CDM65974.1 hypothetical protein PYK22_01983 [Pyrinomonas methylaliphatogenes]